MYYQLTVDVIIFIFFYLGKDLLYVS